MKLVAVTLILLLAMPVCPNAQAPAGKSTLSQGELEQILAPVAIYPDNILAQIMIASTYPIEVVQADRWTKQNSGLKGDALTAALEKQQWDASVKSLVNFPQVLGMMSDKLDWTEKLGDAFLSQQEDVMKTVQRLRAKAQAAGNLKTTNEQKVIVEKETIIIQPANPQVVYVPTYNPAVVYGVWAYPSYPPAYYYPPGYAATAAFSFAAGVAVGAAWGYAWGNCNWGNRSINYNINQNININRNINRNNYQGRLYQGGQGNGNWQHDSAHRGGVAYANQATAARYNKSASADAVKSREAYRGRSNSPGNDLGHGSTGQMDRGKNTGQGGGRGSSGSSAFGGMDSGKNAGQGGGRGSSGSNSAFGGMDHGSSASDFGNRGRESMSQSRSSGDFGGRSSSGGSHSGGFGGGSHSGGFGGGRHR